jgi:hypothetical protein
VSFTVDYFCFSAEVICLTPYIKCGTESVGFDNFTFDAKLMNFSFLTGFTSLPNYALNDFA